MVLNTIRWAVAIAAVLTGWGVTGIGASRAEAQVYTARGPADLFYNYYVPPAAMGVGAEMYPCPRPTPPQIGGTYFTYQPLMPQEFLYHHERLYVTSHPDAPRTVTRVRWNGSSLRNDAVRLFIGRETPRFGRGLSEKILQFGPN